MGTLEGQTLLQEVTTREMGERKRGGYVKSSADERWRDNRSRGWMKVNALNLAAHNQAGYPGTIWAELGSQGLLNLTSPFSLIKSNEKWFKWLETQYQSERRPLHFFSVKQTHIDGTFFIKPICPLFKYVY